MSFRSAEFGPAAKGFDSRVADGREWIERAHEIHEAGTQVPKTTLGATIAYALAKHEAGLTPVSSRFSRIDFDLWDQALEAHAKVDPKADIAWWLAVRDRWWAIALEQEGRR